MTLDQYLAENGITETVFANEVGADQSTINRLRREGRIPSKKLMAAIVERTGGAVRPDDFFGLPVEPSSEAA